MSELLWFSTKYNSAHFAKLDEFSLSTKVLLHKKYSHFPTFSPKESLGEDKDAKLIS